VKPVGKLSASASQSKFDDTKDGKPNTNSKSKSSKRFKGRPSKDEDGNDYVMDTEDAPMRRDSEMIRLIAGDDVKSSLGVGKDSDKTIIGQQPDGLGEMDFKVSDLIKGNFSAVEIPYIEIPGSAPLVYHD
jgi:hypothetical protein